MATLSYEVDPHNRLIIKKTGKETRVKRFRQVVHGRFKTNKKNKLYYEVYKGQGTNVPQKIKFKGEYSLDKARNLILTLQEWRDQKKGNRLRLRTKIISTDSSEMVFLLSSKRPKGVSESYIMKLHGSWQVDRRNKLTFGVEREKNKLDSLALFGAWNIDKNNEIVFSLGPSKTITLKGSWQIDKRFRLKYVLDRTIGSGFSFKTSLGHIYTKAKRPYIQFDITIDISKKKTIKREVLFSFKKKLKRGKELILELSPGSESISLKLTKEVLDKKGIGYIESILSDRERYLGGGISIGW